MKKISLEHTIRNVVNKKTEQHIDEAVGTIGTDKPKEVPNAFFKPVHIHPRKDEAQIPAGGPTRARRNYEMEKAGVHKEEAEQIDEFLAPVAKEVIKQTAPKVLPRVAGAVSSTVKNVKKLFSPVKEPAEPVVVPPAPKPAPPKPKEPPAPAKPDKPIQPSPVEQPPAPGKDPRETQPSPTIPAPGIGFLNSSIILPIGFFFNLLFWLFLFVLKFMNFCTSFIFFYFNVIFHHFLKCQFYIFF